MPAAVPVESPSPAAAVEEPRLPEPGLAEPDLHARPVDELVVTADSVIGLQIDSTVTSEKARVEDPVDAHVARDVQVGGVVVIPAGSRVMGSVILVERGGRMKERARLGIRFHTLVLPDGTRFAISTETLYRNGDEKGTTSAAKVGGGAAAGAILGAIIAGPKGAAIGGGVGAGAGTAAVMAGQPSTAIFKTGNAVTARILAPITVAVER